MLRHLVGIVFLLFVGVTYAQQRIIVTYRASYSTALSAQAIRQEMAKPFTVNQLSQLSAQARIPLQYSHAIGQTGAHVLTLPDGSTEGDRAAVVARLKQMPNIANVEEDIKLYRTSVPNDSNYSALWGMKPVSAGTNYGADFQTAWDTATGTGVVVAVIDTGILPHPDIGSISLGSSVVGGNLVSAGYDFISDCRRAATCPSTTAVSSASRSPVANAFDQGDWVTAVEAASGYFSGCTSEDSSWHGTHVSGTVAAIGNNNTGVIGGAYNAKILPVRVLGKCGGFTSDIANGILWAAGVHGTISNPNPAKVINMSLGGSGACGATFQNAINAAVSAGTSVVVAAGNSNADASGHSPANCTNVITVAATGQTGSRAYYSNYGNIITIAAPGGDSLVDTKILSTLNSGTTTYNSSGFNYVAYQGTSMATPHVAAAVALMKSQNPTLTTTQIKSILQANVTAFPGGSTCTTSNCGAGLLNAAGSVAYSSNITPSLLIKDYGQISSGSTSSATITLTNNNLTSAAVGSASVTNSSNFAITADSCSTQTLAVLGSCTLTVRFTPPTSGQATGTLVLPVTVSGTLMNNGVSLIGTSSQLLTSSATTVSLPYVLLKSSTTASVTFTNNSGQTAIVSTPNVSPSIFAVQTDGCGGQSLSNGDSCTVTVVATPTVVGTYSGTLTVNTTGVNDTAVTVSLTGDAGPTPSDRGFFGSSTGGGGGGGATDIRALLLLLFFTLIVRSQINRQLQRAN